MNWLIDSTVGERIVRSVGVGVGVGCTVMRVVVLRQNGSRQFANPVYEELYEPYALHDRHDRYDQHDHNAQYDQYAPEPHPVPQRTERTEVISHS